MFPAGVPEVAVRYETLRSGDRIRIAECGPAHGRPVLMLHGWGASIYMHRHALLAVGAAGWRAIAVDLRGHGLSDKPRDPRQYTLAAMCDFTRALLDHLGASSLDVLAQSMAGTIVAELLLAGEPRIRAAMLINPACFGRVRRLALARLLTPRWITPILPYLIRRTAVELAHRLVYGNPWREIVHDVDEYWAPSQFLDYAPAMRHLLHEFQWRQMPRDRIAQLRAPVHVLLGGRDRLVKGARAQVEGMSNLTVSFIPDGGHAVNEERPEVVNPLLLAFLGARVDAHPWVG